MLPHKPDPLTYPAELGSATDPLPLASDWDIWPYVAQAVWKLPVPSPRDCHFPRGAPGREVASSCLWLSTLDTAWSTQWEPVSSVPRSDLFSPFSAHLSAGKLRVQG